MTGVEIYDYFRKQVSEYTNDFVSPAFANYLLRKCLVEQIDDNVKNLSVQRNKDEISYFIKTEQDYTVINNRIYTVPVPVSSVSVTTATTFTVVFARPHNLVASTSSFPVVASYPIITITGVTGTLTMNTANGTFGTYTVTSPTSIVITVASATGVYSSGGTMTAQNMITDYFRLLTAFTTFQYGTTYSIKDLTYATPITMEVYENNNLRTGESVLISGALGNTNANGTRYIKKAKLKTATLYSNSSLTTPVAGNSTYLGEAVLYRIKKEYCTVMNSDEKISAFKPTPSNPMCETANAQLLFYPLTIQCTEVRLDYVATPYIITVTDTVNANLYYQESFQFKLINRMAQEFMAIVNSPEEFAAVTNLINQNSNAIS